MVSISKHFTKESCTEWPPLPCKITLNYTECSIKAWHIGLLYKRAPIYFDIFLTPSSLLTTIQQRSGVNLAVLSFALRLFQTSWLALVLVKKVPCIKQLYKKCKLRSLEIVIEMGFIVQGDQDTKIVISLNLYLSSWSDFIKLQMFCLLYSFFYLAGTVDCKENKDNFIIK